MGKKIETEMDVQECVEKLLHIGKDNVFKAGASLGAAQTLFRTHLMGLLTMEISCGHTELRAAVRDVALQLRMTDDNIVSEVFDHIEDERSLAELRLDFA